MKKPIGEAISNALTNTCPHCLKGKIFVGFMKMNRACPECGYQFEREPGYFLGAMSFSYSIGFLFILPTFLYLLFKDYSLLQVVAIPSSELIFLAPIQFRFSRLIWIHLDYRVEPAQKV